MARLPYVDPATATPKVREALEVVPPLNVFRMIAHAETAFRPWLRFGGALLGQAQLDAVLRELAILRVARLTPGAHYEWVQHVPILLAGGGSEQQVEALAADDDSAGCFDDDQRLVLRFTSEVVRDATPSEGTWAAASMRFSPREIIELLLTIGQYMMVGRVMATTHLDVDGPFGVEVARGAAR
jgi:alkylhydroperoxidase family enzyme